MSTPGTIRFAEIGIKPAAPPVGYSIIYFKDDNILYLQDSNGIEVPLGTTNSITELSGEATALGPGNAVVTLSNSAVIGKVLTGFTPGPNSVVLATDTLLQAIQKLQAQITSVSSSITSLTGDVTATGPGAAAATVNSVGGESAADIATSVNDTQSATAANTASTIVKRDASGNFGANEITADLIGNADSSTTASNVGGKTAVEISQSVDDTQDATSINTASTIVKRDASGNFSAGTITANLTGTASGNEPPIVATTSADYYRGDKTFQNFNEAAQDAIGTILTDTANIDLIYNDALNEISADLVDTAVAPDTYGGPDRVGQFTVDQKGRLTFADDVVIDITKSQVSDFNHASSHLPSGSDPLATAAPLANLTATTTNALGTAESFSKSDHGHAISTGIVSTQLPDQANSAGVSVNLARADHGHTIPSGPVVQIGTSNFNGASASFALADHVHAHGNQTSGSLHAAATTSVNGFMSSADKTKLDNATATNTPNTLVLRDGSGDFSAGNITASLTGAASDNLLKAGDVMIGYFRTAVVALTDVATINTDAALGNIFTVTITGNRTFAAPTNPLADQKITYKIRQDATGGRIITWDSAFNFGVDLSGVPNSTSPNTFDYYGFQYNAATSRWDCLAISRGY